MKYPSHKQSRKQKDDVHSAFCLITLPWVVVQRAFFVYMSLLKQLHREHIEDSITGAVVVLKTFHLATTTKDTSKALQVEVAKVYISTKVLKHLYDKKPAAEYFYVIDKLADLLNIHNRYIATYPQRQGTLFLLRNILNIL